ncbi:hypothetical protein KXW98_000978 [Aspergillus fumigatus]|jgi:hypothetical protein|uniref:Uncharacterized protein n=3 Tax=Aspergillus fumigatus TaxID=746128 RepID=Q4WII5_ASPFU|nr:conserved hypothetical protein [Aspergillus fumigatus Af293]EDP53836.1 conserved hypothetical protein [Aspergillus fumigatus A1163]KAF4253651.1 hypothetical protein CNMCM8714_006030 [Aspergillus fumigatus]KMK62353.1 hypothetical protein Y699_04736 [Aspergillus fumigatus Z5]EAL87270.1 conserved hypothetical protein [Aspergillus fumigatus Af293]KAF4259035.1 hypothetical protein CNMCM8057_002939 [Aspergillus fumigatus]
MADSYTSSSYYYSSTTNTTNGSSTTGHRYTTTSHTDPDGNTVVRTAHQDLGQPAVVEERRYDRTGQEQLMLASGTETLPGGVRRITDLDDETGATTYDAGTQYGIPTGSANEREESSHGDEWWSSSVGRSSYDIGPPLPGARTYNAYTGAYEEQRADYDADGVPRYRDRGRGRGQGQSGYSAEQRASREFETDQGTRLKRETDVDMSDVLM